MTNLFRYLKCKLTGKNYVRQFSIKSKNGPSVAFISGCHNKDKVKREQEQKEFLQYASTHITPNKNSFDMLEEHLITHYGAVPCGFPRGKEQVMIVNIIINHFPSLIDYPSHLAENATKKQIIEHSEKIDVALKKAYEYPWETLELVTKAYSICVENKENIIIQLELTTEYMTTNNLKISDELNLWKGVSKEDIETQSKRFMVYAYQLQKMDRLNFKSQK